MKIEKVIDLSEVSLTKVLEEKATWARQSDGTMKLANNARNCILILENDPQLKQCLIYNELKHSLEVIKPLPWDNFKHFKTRVFNDTDFSSLRVYFEKYKLINIKSFLYDALQTIENRHKYHPIKEYFLNLKWDNRKRLDTLLYQLFKTANDIYHSEVIKIFMVGAIKRIFEPACKYDYMPIISGNQGIGKSSFFKMLSINPQWYLEDLRRTDKSGIEQIQGKWIVEWAELNAMKREKEVASIKTFITTTNDTMRIPYARYTTDFPRQCVFCGTTNESNFLYDRSGNRRFLPVKFGLKRGELIDISYLKSNLDHLWAEAYELYKSGFTPVLSTEAEQIAIEKQSGALEDDPNIGLIELFLNKDGWGTAEAPKEVCVKMLWDKALKKSYDMNKLDIIYLIRIMDNMPGWQRYNGSKDNRKMFKEYRKQTCWVRTDGQDNKN